MRTSRSLTVCRGVLPSWGGASFSRGCFLLGGLLPGPPSWVGCLLLGGGCASFPFWGVWWYPSMQWGRLPLVNRITHTSKNITLATTSLRPVTKLSTSVTEGFVFKTTTKSPLTWNINGSRYILPYATSDQPGVTKLSSSTTTLNAKVTTHTTVDSEGNQPA